MPDEFNERFLYRDCERLGLMKEGDREDALRRWTGHVQRHFAEKVMKMQKERPIPDDWKHHFRGDKLGKGARDAYNVPQPEEVREMYLAFYPTLGFMPHGRVVTQELAVRHGASEVAQARRPTATPATRGAVRN